MTLQSEWQNEEQQRQDEIEQHEPPETEFVFYRMVQHGDMIGVADNLKSRHYHRIALDTRLSENPVQNFRYHCIVVLALMTRFCMEGGMPGEQAYRISDFYIHKIDTATTEEEIEVLHDEACFDFTRRMQQRQNQPICSKPVTLCLNYIYAHLQEKISIPELAEAIGLHPNYLSKLFRQQMGCTLHSYILDQKIHAAKQMLRFSERSFAEIANLLAFSSQSHFIQVFSKRVGVTPHQYREAKFRTGLMR